jgi:TonB family protein
METFALYLLKSASWLTGFTLIYLLFLRNERFFMLKRIYLIAGIVVSLVFPFFTIHYLVELPAPQTVPAEFLSAETGHSSTIAQEATQGTLLNKSAILIFIYLSGVLLMALRVLKNFGSIFKTIRKADINNREDVRLVRASEFQSPFSFFNYVFVNPSVSDTEVTEIMNHELVHVKQKHWFDLLLAESLRIVQWANPLAWIYTGFIRQNHEFLADEAALKRTSDPAVYKATLLNQMFRSPVISLSNSFNYSLNRKRFEMMKRIVTSPYRKLKVLLVIPVFAIVFYAFAAPEYQYIPVSGDNTTEVLTIVQSPVIQQKEVKGVVLDENGRPLSDVDIVTTGTMGNATGTTTGVDGRFSFTNLRDDAVLFFSIRGYKRLRLDANFTSSMSVKMEKDPDYKPPVTAPRQRLQPVVAVDGILTEKSSSEVRKELGYNYGTMSTLQGKAATDKYGEKAVNGVTEILTRAKAIEMGLNPPMPRLGPDDYPTFQGKAWTSFTDWVVGQAKYPFQAQTDKVEGYITVSFSVNSDGTVGNVVSPMSAQGDQVLIAEVIRVVKSSPNWEPPKNVNITEPFPSIVSVSFKLPDKIGQDAPYVVVEDMPMFPGGDGELLKFIAENTIYPEAAKADTIQGRVTVRFIVNRDGNTEGISVLRGIHPLLYAEAVRVVGTLKGFKPGMQGGKPVPVWFSVPITFTLK